MKTNRKVATCGARREGRTPTPAREPDFESGASASSAIRAILLNHEITFFGLHRLISKWITIRVDFMFLLQIFLIGLLKRCSATP